MEAPLCAAAIDYLPLDALLIHMRQIACDQPLLIAAPAWAATPRLTARSSWRGGVLAEPARISAAGRTPALAGIIGGRRARMVSMISPGSRPEIDLHAPVARPLKERRVPASHAALRVPADAP